MNKAVELIRKYFDSLDWHYSIPDKNGTVIATGVGGLDHINSGTIKIYIDADDDGSSIHIISVDYIKFPQSKLAEILTVVNACNSKYRWVKFTANLENSIVCVEDDAVLDDNSAGEEAHQLVLRMAHIADEAFPLFMRIIYS